MRLRDILFLVNENLPQINAISFATAQYEYTITNIKDIHICFNKLSKIDVLKKDIEKLLSKYTFFMSDQESITIEGSRFSSCKDELREFQSKCAILKGILSQMVQTQDENIISFKLYEFENFSEFANFCDDLSKKILAPLKRLNIDVRLGELEMGSEWVSIICGTGLGLTFLVCIIRQAYDILIHDHQKLKVAKSVTESLDFGNEFIENYNRKISELFEKTC